MKDYRFSIRHPVKQVLLLRALNEMRSDLETPAETQAVVDMIHELEILLRSRRRHRKLPGRPSKMERWKAPRHSSYTARVRR